MVSSRSRGAFIVRSAFAPSRGRVFCVVIALSLFFASGCFHRQPQGHRPSYRGARLVDVADIRFDDGDTFDYKNTPIRVLGIDTPEIAHPDLGVHEAQPFGPAAAESTRAWIERARTVELVLDGRDLYDRTLAHVFVDGELLACRLIRHALAYETVSHYGDSGYPDLAQEILDTARSSPKPQFEPPYRWKQKHRARSPR